LKENNHNQEKKDKREWAVMQLFRSSYPAFPLGRLEKSECPDFLLYAHNDLIGIELTELKYEREDKDFNLRAHEDFLSDIMVDAQTIVESASNLKLIVDVHFTNELGPALSLGKDCSTLLLRQAFTEVIANIVMENTPEATGIRYIIDRTSKYGYHHLPAKIESISIRNMTGRFKEGLWYAGISTKVKPLSIASISQRLVVKNQKLKGYNSTCNEFWLIIIQNSFLMSSSYEPLTAREALRHYYQSDFDKVFVFERSERGVTLLNTKKYKMEKG
jgi:hypothetical protein